MDELKPCPFCGASAEFGKIPRGSRDGGGEFVQCTNPMCSASSALIFPLKEAAQPLLTERWNRRATNQPSVCRCDLRTKLVGDGCEVCNPEYAADLAASNGDASRG